MPIDDRTTNRSYQLPNASNLLSEDVARLRAALSSIDADVFARYTKTEVDTLINNLIQGAPGALDTLNELAAAMGDDPNFAATVTNALALKANAADVYSKAESDARYVQGQTQAEMVFTATANQSVFTLTTAVINKPSALVTVDGVVQPTSEYSLNMTGTQLTLSEGVPAGTVVRVLVLGVSSEGAPGDDTVTTAKVRDGAITTPKLADGALAASTAGLAKMADGFFTATAAALAKFADGFLAATAAGRAKMADGFVTPAKLSQPMTLMTAQASTAGTAIDFTGIPSWAKRVTVMFDRVGTSGGNGTSGNNFRFLLGTASEFELTGYDARAILHSTSGEIATSTTGFVLQNYSNSTRLSGSLTFANVSANTWVGTGAFGSLYVFTLAGSKTLASALSQLRITTVNGTDTFNAGTINVLYE